MTPTGEIKSPGLDLDIPYLPNSVCNWRISTDANRRIALGIVNNTFDIDDTGIRNIFGCSHNHDFLDVHDGIHVGATSFNGPFCGNVSGEFSFRTVYSSGRYMFVRFVSDGMNQGKGFHLRFHTFLAGKALTNLLIFLRRINECTIA